MNKLKLLLIGGLVFLIALPALASNGNPRLNDEIPGAGSALVFACVKPFQDDDKSIVIPNPSRPTHPSYLDLLVYETNYFIDTDAYPGYTKYGITSTPRPTTNGYFKLMSVGKYAAVRFGLGSPVGPADWRIDPGSVYWYNTGDPAAPSSLLVDEGFETARVTFKLNPEAPATRYYYSTVEVEVKRVSDDSIVMASGNVSTTLFDEFGSEGKNNRVSTTYSYSCGELIDGRVLEPDTEYKISLMGTVRKSADPVAGTYDSLVVTTFFKTKSAPPQTFPLDLSSSVPGAGLGINAFALPFGPEASTGKWYAPDNSTFTEFTNAYEFIKAVNEAAGSNVVSTFGYWDETSQQLVGVMIPGEDPEPVKADLEAISLSQGVGYQVYLIQPVSILIKNAP